MGDIFKFSGPYLYPFVIEYSLIAAAVMFAMWKNIGNNPRYYSLILPQFRYFISLNLGLAKKFNFFIPYFTGTMVKRMIALVLLAVR